MVTIFFRLADAVCWHEINFIIKGYHSIKVNLGVENVYESEGVLVDNIIKEWML